MDVHKLSGWQNDCCSFETKIIFKNLLHPRRLEKCPRVCVPVSLSYRKKVKGKERNIIFLASCLGFSVGNQNVSPGPWDQGPNATAAVANTAKYFGLATKKIHVARNIVISSTAFQNSNQPRSKCANQRWFIRWRVASRPHLPTSFPGSSLSSEPSRERKS